MNGRGLAQKSIDIINTAYAILEEIQPASVRGVCYQLFNQKLIKSMKTGETQKVTRLLVIARENGTIPWEWIVDETRRPERISAWSNLADYGETILRAYRKDFWHHQKERVQVWSEKGTVRGVLSPVLDEFAVTFDVKHGFDSATCVKDVAEATCDLERPLIVLYVGDWDPSGLWMPAKDLPERLDRYGANVRLIRIALTYFDCNFGGLPSFPADTKDKDPRHKWFIENYGTQCWELDAMPANDLRRRVRGEILHCIDKEAWNHCEMIQRAERESLCSFKWGEVFSDQYKNTPDGKP